MNSVLISQMDASLEDPAFLLDARAQGRRVLKGKIDRENTEHPVKFEFQKNKDFFLLKHFFKYSWHISFRCTNH